MAWPRSNDSPHSPDTSWITNAISGGAWDDILDGNKTINRSHTSLETITVGSKVITYIILFVHIPLISDYKFLHFPVIWIYFNIPVDYFIFLFGVPYKTFYLVYHT